MSGDISGHGSIAFASFEEYHRLHHRIGCSRCLADGKANSCLEIFSHERRNVFVSDRSSSVIGIRVCVRACERERVDRKPSAMMDSVDYNSMASNHTAATDDQQQDNRRNRKVDYRFLIPSRDAGGSSIDVFFPPIDVRLVLQRSLAKVERSFRTFVSNIDVKFKWPTANRPNVC